MSTWSSLEPGIDAVSKWLPHDCLDAFPPPVVWVDVATERSWSDRVRVIVGDHPDKQGLVYLTPDQVRTLIGMLTDAIGDR